MQGEKIVLWIDPGYNLHSTLKQCVLQSASKYGCTPADLLRQNAELTIVPNSRQKWTQALNQIKRECLAIGSSKRPEGHQLREYFHTNLKVPAHMLDRVLRQKSQVQIERNPQVIEHILITQLCNRLQLMTLAQRDMLKKATDWSSYGNHAEQAAFSWFESHLDLLRIQNPEADFTLWTNKTTLYHAKYPLLCGQVDFWCRIDGPNPVEVLVEVKSSMHVKKDNDGRPETLPFDLIQDNDGNFHLKEDSQVYTQCQVYLHQRDMLFALVPFVFADHILIVPCFRDTEYFAKSYQLLERLFFEELLPSVIANIIAQSITSEKLHLSSSNISWNGVDFVLSDTPEDEIED